MLTSSVVGSCIFLIVINICSSLCTSSVIIGILSEKCHKNLTACDGHGESKSFIVASYVKALESSGARVIPVLLGRDEDYYRNIVRSIGGLVLPGVKYLHDEEFQSAANLLIRESKKLHDNYHIKVPILGVGLGMSTLLVEEFGNDVIIASECDAHDNTPLYFTIDFGQHELFKHINNEMVNNFKNLPFAIQSTSKCVTEHTVHEQNISASWHISSYVHYNDSNDRHVATMENLKYPFFGVSFHPEKFAFESNPTKDDPRYNEDFFITFLKSNRYFYDFFVDYSCKSNNNTAVNENTMSNLSIFNYPVTYTGKKPLAYFQQTYVF